MQWEEFVCPFEHEEFCLSLFLPFIPNANLAFYLQLPCILSPGQHALLQSLFPACDCAWCLAVIPSHFAALNWMCPLSARKPNLFKSC